MNLAELSPLELADLVIQELEKIGPHEESGLGVSPYSGASVTDVGRDRLEAFFREFIIVVGRQLEYFAKGLETGRTRGKP